MEFFFLSGGQSSKTALEYKKVKKLAEELGNIITIRYYVSISFCGGVISLIVSSHKNVGNSNYDNIVPIIPKFLEKKTLKIYILGKNVVLIVLLFSTFTKQLPTLIH